MSTYLHLICMYFKKQRHYFANKGPFGQGYGFSSGHVWLWELDYKESWVPKNWCFWTVVLEKTLASPLDCKEIQLAHPKGDKSWVFIGRTDETETPILWPPDAKRWFIWKDPDAGKGWGQEKGMTENETVGWHHRLDGHGFGWTLGVGDGQGGLACYGSRGRRESDTTEWLNWTELILGWHWPAFTLIRYKDPSSKSNCIQASDFTGLDALFPLSGPKRWNANSWFFWTEGMLMHLGGSMESMVSEVKKKWGED